MFKKIGQIFLNLGIVFVCAFLGALSGQNWKWLRRYMIPLLVTIYTLIIVKSWWVLSIYSMAGVLSIGYGLWDINDTKVSFLGNIAYKLFPDSRTLQNIFCRGIIGILLSFSMLSVSLITHNWLSYLLGSVGIILIWALNSWQGYGEISVKLFGKTYNLLKVDVVTYGVTTLGCLIIIYGIFG
jgi:hypothetical protein